jgi:hypothetical protein
MPTRRAMKSVLRGFLGAYTSRYSDHRGYWLHGQLPSNLRDWSVDLLGSTPASDELAEAARSLATRRFAEQLHKAGLTFDVVREATLRIERIPDLVQGPQGEFQSDGHMVRFTARSVTDHGRTYQDEHTLFVAPHDPAKERRRVEDDRSA